MTCCLDAAVKPAYNGSASDRNFLCYGQVKLWILGTEESPDMKTLRLKTGFRYARVPFKTGVVVLVMPGFRSRQVLCGGFCLY